jgi:hypothetical protein
LCFGARDLHADWPTGVAPSSGPQKTTAFGGACSLAGGKAATFLGQTLASSVDIPQALRIKSQRFHQALCGMYLLNPGLRFIDDSLAPNAHATPAQLVNGAPNGTILLGARLIRQEIAKNTVTWEGSVALIHAHEFGHIGQFNYGYVHRNPTMELQADALGGAALCYLIAVEAAANGNLPWIERMEIGRRRWAELEHAASTLFSIGDYSFNDPNHHGTPSQRLLAFSQGFQMIANNSGPLGIQEVLQRTLAIANRS